MTYLSNNEITVLLALRAHALGLTTTQLAALTGLKCESLQQPLSRLLSENRIRSEVTNHGERYHVSAHPVAHPPVSRSQEWLAAFAAAQPQYEVRDAAATTYASCGVVLLAAIVGGTKDADRIARTTTLPAAFVRMVLEGADRQHIWARDSVFCLQQQLCGGGFDFEEIEKSLHWVKEDFWRPDSTLAIQLTESRARHQVGGRLDDWTEAEDVSFDG